MTATRPELPMVLFATPAEWEGWLREHHTEPDGLWLRIAKKGSGVQSVTYAEALDVALCWGWIDGQKRSLDAACFLQKFTPRRPRSVWSKVNREHVARLVEAGRMQPAGQREVDRARADGRWDAAYDSPSTATVPEDLQRALDADPAARDFFATLSSANRYAILWRIATAKRAATRAARIEQFVAMCAEGRTLH